MTKYCQICGKEMPANRLKKKKTTCCRSCAQKLRYQNVEERQKTALATKKVMSNDQIRAKISTTLKQDKYKESQKQRQAALSNNKEAQEKKSKTLLKTWEIKDRQEHSLAIKQGQKENNAISKISKASIAHWKDDKYRIKVIKAEKAVWTKEKREKQSKTLATPKVQAKINAAKRANHSFNTSKSETEVFELLQQVFKDVQTQYRSELYPFNCDFYIPSLDLYIECHFHWTHGGRPFDENDKSCLEQLAQWKEQSKTSKFYQKAIKTWIDLDVRKKQIAEDNKLNLVIFYSKGTFITWLNKISI